MSPPPSSSSAGAGEFFRGAAVVSATREGFEAEGAADSFVDLAQRAPDPLQQLDDRLLRHLHDWRLADPGDPLVRHDQGLPHPPLQLLHDRHSLSSALVTVVHWTNVLLTVSFLEGVSPESLQSP